MSEEIKTLRYRFKLANGDEKEFIVRLKRPGMKQDAPARRDLPKWTELGFNQCPNCPLKTADTPRCPVAVNLVEIVEFFKDRPSFEIVEVKISSDEREYSGTKSLQMVLSSLIGLHMSTSGCPILDNVRPMAFTHLPFSTVDETMYRVISMYLLAQFMRERRGKKPDWELKDLVRLYEQIYSVNVAFLKRIQSIEPKDASLNAIASLDCAGAFTRFTLEKKSLAQLDELFSAYLKDP